MSSLRRLSLIALSLLLVGLLALGVMRDSVCAITSPAHLSMARLLLLLVTLVPGLLIAVIAWLLFLLALVRRRLWFGVLATLLAPLLATLGVVFPRQPLPCPGGPLYDTTLTGLLFKALFFLALAFTIPLIASASVSLTPLSAPQEGSQSPMSSR